MLALLFRAGEGILAANAALQNARLIEFAKRTAGSANADIVGTSLLYGAGMLVGASLFAFGSTIFSYLFLRSRIIPVWRANVARDERLIEELADDRVAQLAQLEHRAAGGGDLRLVAVARVEILGEEVA